MVKVWKYQSEDDRLFTNEDGGALVTDEELYDEVQWYGPILPPRAPDG